MPEFNIGKFFRKLETNSHFNNLISPSERQRTSQQADRFLHDVSLFISDKFDQISANDRLSLQLNLKPHQISAIQFLKQHVVSGHIKPKNSSGSFDSSRPYIEKKYIARGSGFKIVSNVEGMLNNVNSNYLNISVTYPIDESSSHRRLSLTGNISLKDIGVINFISFPYKPKDSKNVINLLGLDRTVDGFTYQPFYSGDRISINMDNGKLRRIEQYHFLGAFEGQQTQKVHYIYGSNIAKSNENEQRFKTIFNPRYPGFF